MSKDYFSVEHGKRARKANRAKRQPQPAHQLAHVKGMPAACDCNGNTGLTRAANGIDIGCGDGLVARAKRTVKIKADQLDLLNGRARVKALFEHRHHSRVSFPTRRSMASRK